jgi:acetyl-CoA synthetase
VGDSAALQHHNIGVDVCDKWADGSGRLALIYEDENGQATRYTFDELKTHSDRFANVLLASGAQRGDRIGIFLSQSIETAVAHLAAYKAGMVAVPLFALFGVDAIEHRLSDSGAVALITNTIGVEKVAEIRNALPALRSVFNVDLNGNDHGRPALAHSFWDALHAAPTVFTPADTGADEPAVIIYTSGTTGKPKGALHGHRVLLGHLPGVELSQQGFPTHATLMWTPADWAWIGGLFDVLHGQ